MRCRAGGGSLYEECVVRASYSPALLPAQNAVLFYKANGTSTKPVSVPNVNSISITKAG